MENVSFNNITWNINGACKISDAVKPVGARRVDLDPDRINYAVNPHQFIMVNTKDISINGLRLYDLTGEELAKRGLYYIANSENIQIHNGPTLKGDGNQVAINSSNNVIISGRAIS